MEFENQQSIFAFHKFALHADRRDEKIGPVEKEARLLKLKIPELQKNILLKKS